jgi:hypothetical protein
MNSSAHSGSFGERALLSGSSSSSAAAAAAAAAGSAAISEQYASGLLWDSAAAGAAAAAELLDEDSSSSDADMEGDSEYARTREMHKKKMRQAQKVYESRQASLNKAFHECLEVSCCQLTCAHRA